MKPLEGMGKFKTVVVDPPWNIGLPNYIRRKTPGGRYRKSLSYQPMSLEAIGSLDVGSVLDDDAFLFCWTTNRFLPAAFGLIQAWGVSYSFTMTWRKPGGPQLPHGPAFNSEFCLVGRVGSPKFSDTRAFAACNHWERGEHSSKPEKFYDLLRRVTPEPRIDIFGRRRIPGFVSWGDEAPDGPALPGVYQDVLF